MDHRSEVDAYRSRVMEEMDQERQKLGEEATLIELQRKQLTDKDRALRSQWKDEERVRGVRKEEEERLFANTRQAIAEEREALAKDIALHKVEAALWVSTTCDLS